MVDFMGLRSSISYMRARGVAQKVSSSPNRARWTTLGLSSSGSSVTSPPAVSSRSSTMRFEASRAGVRSSRGCGTWNCIVLGGLMPAPGAASSSSLSLSQSCGCLARLALSAPLWVRSRAGVSTLTPGMRVFRAGVSNMSECSCGAGTAGEESRS